jgi:pilus assembly protein Flp/PilA
LEEFQAKVDKNFSAPVISWTTARPGRKFKIWRRLPIIKVTASLGRIFFHKGEVMSGWLAKLAAWLRRQEGASAVEYGILLAGIALVVAVGIYSIGGNLNTKFNSVQNQLADAADTDDSGKGKKDKDKSPPGLAIAPGQNRDE